MEKKTKRIIVEKLAEMSQNQFREIQQEMRNGFSELKGILTAMFNGVKSIDEEMKDMHIIRKVDIPQLRDDVEALQRDMASIKRR